MIDLYTKKLDELWCGVALNESTIAATTFGFDEKKVLGSLLRELPFGLTFQEAQEGCFLAEKVLHAIKETFDGKDKPFNFKFCMNYLSTIHSRC